MKHINTYILSILLTVSLLTTKQAKAQGEWMRFYDYNRKIHFGFMVGTNTSTLKYQYSADWYNQDTLTKITQTRLPGITLGAVVDLHLGEHFNLRMIPTLVLSQRNLTYSGPLLEQTSEKQIESSIVELPLLLKFKSIRHQNVRFYIIGGFKYGYDLGSDEKAKRNPVDPKVIIGKNNFSYEFGSGFDMYFKYFKFSPEVKLSKGINNVLIPDTKIYSRVFSGMRSNFIFFSMYFEG